MSDFLKLINDHCQLSEGVIKLKEVVDELKLTAAVIVDLPDNARRAWPWKVSLVSFQLSLFTVTKQEAIKSYSKLFILLRSVLPENGADEQPENFFKSKESGLKLDDEIVQVVTKYTAKEDTDLKFSRDTIQKLAAKSLAIANRTHADGQSDMTELEKIIDSTECVEIGNSFNSKSSLKDSNFEIDLFLATPTMPSDRHPFSTPPKHLHTISGQEITVGVNRRISNNRTTRAAILVKTMIGEELRFLCTQDFLMVVKPCSTSGKLKIVHAPVLLKNICGREHEIYGRDLENIVEVNLDNLGLLIVQISDADDRKKFVTYLNSISGLNRTFRKVEPSFWIFNKPQGKKIPDQITAAEENTEILDTTTQEMTIATPQSPNSKKNIQQMFDCDCYPFISKGVAGWEKLSRCKFAIVADCDTLQIRIVVRIEVTHVSICGADIGYALNARPQGERDISLLLINYVTKKVTPYLIRVKNTLKRNEVIFEINKYQKILTLANYDTATPYLIRENSPKYVIQCPHLIPSNELTVDCLVTVKYNTSALLTQNILESGHARLNLKVLKSPMTDFRVIEVTTRRGTDLTRIYLNSVITKDMTVQDCRTPTCSTFKISFASKPGIEYVLDIITAQYEDADGDCIEGRQPRPLKVSGNSPVAQAVSYYLCRKIVAYDAVFGTIVESVSAHLQSGAQIHQQVVLQRHSALAAQSLLRQQAIFSSQRTQRVERRVQIPMRANPTQLHASMSSPRSIPTPSLGAPTQIPPPSPPRETKPTATRFDKGKKKVTGWVAAKVAFFNNLAAGTRTTTTTTASAQSKLCRNKQLKGKVTAFSQLTSSPSLPSPSSSSLISPVSATSYQESASLNPDHAAITAALAFAVSPTVAPAAEPVGQHAEVLSIPLRIRRSQAMPETQARLLKRILNRPELDVYKSRATVSPPTGAPADVVANWVFIPKAAKLMLARSGQFNESNVLLAKTFMESVIDFAISDIVF
ncbi:hypothetical protein HK100_000012 [Physocladia obscura]|uniref:Uncharacterized protein n=1 Tax=Physocladia obscura TaxID=109957 RepID=A0AAD5TCW2_9FUNG|nr:hypothetical protein HK100_000012 [Physocladia obscura]